MKLFVAKTVFLCLPGALLAFYFYAPPGAHLFAQTAQAWHARNAHRAINTPNVHLPTVEPVEYLPIATEAAIATNASVAKISNPGPAAKPFFIAADNREAATKCLTSAIYYEAAGEGAEGERAVAQVVVNRARNFAFPASICGVIYQGAERATGCQFTFSCDGSLARSPNRAAWVFAKKTAKAALNGYVYAPVGLSTHYHTNKVVPYWASSLVFASAVKSQLFYRWKGRFGEVNAFNRSHLQPEIDYPRFIDSSQENTSKINAVMNSRELQTSDFERSVFVKPLLDKYTAAAASNIKSDRKPQTVLAADRQIYTLLIDQRHPNIRQSLLPPRRGSQAGRTVAAPNEPVTIAATTLP